MRKLKYSITAILVLIMLLSALPACADGIIVYTAHQGWLSRVYLLRMDGSVINYHEYDFYYLADLEVVNNEAYVAEAFAPRMYKIDLLTGELDLIIDDWSLYYFYDLASDGNHFYLNEWDLNCYDITGDKIGTVSFDESVNGGAWDGTYYWTLNDQNQIKCWDVSDWPTVTEEPDNTFAPPTSDCRGLWFDGNYFWTAESIEGSLGNIYRFDYHGEIMDQWMEPAYQGWSACIITNYVPEIPDPPSGPTEGEVGTEYDFSSTTTDPDGDDIFYLFDWGDGTDTGWIGPYNSEDTSTTSHAWTGGTYYVKVRAKDTYGQESGWSDSLSVAILTHGDANGDGEIEVGDVVVLIDYLYRDGDPPDPFLAGDATCDEDVSVDDVVYLISYLFRDGPLPEC